METSLEQTIEQYQADFMAASISSGSLDPEGQYLASQTPPRRLTTVAAENGPYTIYRLEIKYLGDTGKLLLPMSPSSTVTTRIAKVAQSYGYKIVLFEVARANSFPILPAIQETDGCQLVNHQITAMADVFDASNQKRVFRTAGFYLYLIKTPRVPGTDDMPVPSLPLMGAPSLPLIEADFQTGLAPEEETE